MYTTKQEQRQKVWWSWWRTITYARFIHSFSYYHTHHHDQCEKCVFLRKLIGITKENAASTRLFLDSLTDYAFHMQYHDKWVLSRWYLMLINIVLVYSLATSHETCSLVHVDKSFRINKIQTCRTIQEMNLEWSIGIFRVTLRSSDGNKWFL